MAGQSLTNEQLENNSKLKEIWKHIIATANDGDPEYSYALFWQTIAEYAVSEVSD